MPHTTGTMKFIRNLPLYEKEKPYNLSYGTYNEGVATNVENEEKQVRVEDIRGRETEFSYEPHSFQCVRLPNFTALDGTEKNTLTYLEEIRSYLLNEFRADRVICYDIRQRNTSSRSRAETHGNDNYFGGTQVPAPPVWTVHIDHTLQGGFHRMQRHMSDEELQKYLAEGWRARLINVWKPESPITKAPLAVCDNQTLSPGDLLETDQVNTKYQGEIYSVKYNERQQFYYLSNQQPDEAWIMISFDSLHGKALDKVIFCAHSSFQDLNTLPDAPERRSVEVRAIVLNKVS